MKPQQVRALRNFRTACVCSSSILLNVFIDAERRAREERSTEQAAEITRQEKLLAMVSQTLGKQTNKTLDSSIRSEIRDSLLPAISKTVRESVDAELAAVLRSSLQKTIPDSMNNFFNRPDVTNHLVRSL